MKKSLYLFLLAAVIALGSCKKSCNFPKYLDGKYCTDIRESLIGDYTGTFYNIYGTTYQPNQVITMVVTEGTGDFTNLYIYGLNGYINEQDSITFPNQFQLNGGQPYHISGTGSFGDTTIDGKANRSLSLYLSFVEDSTHVQISSYFYGLR